MSVWNWYINSDSKTGNTLSSIYVYFDEYAWQGRFVSAHKIVRAFKPATKVIRTPSAM